MGPVSDQRLRELERKWRETGSVEDEAAYLRERVRVGDLTQERLELAAYCGHGGAKRACGCVDLPNPNNWALGLEHWPLEASVRVALSAARSAVDVWRTALPDKRRPLEAFAMTEEWLTSHEPIPLERIVALTVEIEGLVDPDKEEAGGWPSPEVECAMLALFSLLEALRHAQSLPGAPDLATRRWSCAGQGATAIQFAERARPDCSRSVLLGAKQELARVALGSSMLAG